MSIVVSSASAAVIAPAAASDRTLTALVASIIGGLRRLREGATTQPWDAYDGCESHTQKHGMTWLATRASVGIEGVGVYQNEVDDELRQRWTTCWKCDAPINWGWQKCNRCWWAICHKCQACRRPMATSKYGRRGPCPREIPLFAETLSLRWARDHLNNPINWAQYGRRGPTLVTPNADPAMEWLSRLRRDFRLPGLIITTKGLNGKYGAQIFIPNAWDLLNNPRAVELAALALEHQPEKGIVLEAGKDRLSARIGGPAYACVEGQTFETYENVTWPVLDDLEDRRRGWNELMVPVA